MKPGRFPGRLLIFASLLWRLPGQCLRSRPATATVGRILVLHQFLLGDALMATSLLAKLRQQFPLAQIVLACPPLQAPLYQERPYGIQILAWHPRDFSSIRRLFAQPRFDLVYLMGENRLSYLARAMGARWIIGFAGERPAYKNWLVDQAIPYAQQPECWSESAARLVEGPQPAAFQAHDWPWSEPELPPLPAHYVVLHVGASCATKLWPSANWRQLAAALRSQGRHILWSCGPGEQALIEDIIAQSGDSVLAGALSLCQLRAVLAHAQACVSPDTGVAHLAKLAGAPLVMLFGPGSATVFGPGRFFARTPCIAVGTEWFPCRNQRDLHHRDLDWILRCSRNFAAPPAGCRQALCMQAIRVEAVLQALNQVLNQNSVFPGPNQE